MKIKLKHKLKLGRANYLLVDKLIERVRKNARSRQLTNADKTHNRTLNNKQARILKRLTSSANCPQISQTLSSGQSIKNSRNPQKLHEGRKTKKDKKEEEEEKKQAHN